MKALLELHYLQNFAPSNLNRDDTGSPKDAFFGGSRRLRISSQSFKRAMRQDFAARQILSTAELGQRTKRAHEAIAGLLEGEGRTPEQRLAAAELALGGLGLPVKDGKNQYLLFLGRDELQRVADIVNANWAEFQAAAPEPDSGDGKKKKASKKAALSGDLGKQLAGALNGSKAVDVALFGRMLADLPDKNADAAAQVAHPISTHALRERQYDFYTAVDDLKPQDNAGADMLGTVEFASATVYRYACLDLAKLLENLQGDRDLLARGLRAFLYASVFAAPTGKQNTFAAHNLPGLMVQVVRRDTSPRNLANAFERGVQAERGGGYLKPSTEALAGEMRWQNSVFGDAGSARHIAREGTDEVFGQPMETVDALIDATVAEAMSALEA
ncbi:type I-E CRISPR-associated protein Cas7/Cse4/CasC [Deinococcus sp. HMF7604]|uniref:type I-E CRISPR-associated protein Cas7/Cse4/CasC n=1 Tax=Deinococcus betulae TaxID=2873312 RepID=UPI001CCE2245|nr:type I-E CRISPR-associated protein Cas7/Cse4/CasC [Deinococcus betulae]MBZ9751897.1 type I-E CRISPR-associated protein Cas7/Cse4/CasC [Deinococcus betulae]